MLNRAPASHRVMLSLRSQFLFAVSSAAGVNEAVSYSLFSSAADLVISQFSSNRQQSQSNSPSSAQFTGIGA
jgi:hypothetical protein